jgi:hypothetical protein
MLYAVLVAFLSWFGLCSVVQTTISTTTKTMFFVLLFVVVTSTMMPVVSYLNARFGTFADERLYRVRFVRQSVWIGVFVTVIAWLQMRRMLGTTRAMIMMAVLILIEVFMITRERPVDDL